MYKLIETNIIASFLVEITDDTKVSACAYCNSRGNEGRVREVSTVVLRPLRLREDHVGHHTVLIIPYISC